MKPPRKLLIVDDDTTFSGQLADILGDEGYVVSTLPSATEALPVLRAGGHGHVLMLLDVQMPGMSGIDLVRETADLPDRPAIILMTAFSSFHAAVECLRMGAEDYITKPFDLDLLLLTLERVQERVELRRRNDELSDLLTANARTFLKSQEAIRGLTEILAYLPPANEFPQTVFGILRHVHHILESGHSSITMHGAAAGLTYHLPANGSSAPRRESVDRVLAWVASTGMPVVHGAPVPDPALAAPLRALDGSVFLPIHNAGEPFGALHVSRPGASQPFTTADVQLIEFVCAEISVLHANARLYESHEKMTIGAISALGKALHHKDEGTGAHSSRTRGYLARLMSRLNLPKEERDKITFAMQLHDIGKIRVPATIINKPGPLNDEEWGVMRMHPVWGFEILHSDCLLKEVATLVRHHHERYDGTGYPDRLKGKAIPFGSRFLSLVDAFDAMRSDRPYRRAMPLSLAVDEIRTNLGTQFDPDLGQTFLETVGEAITTI